MDIFITHSTNLSNLFENQERLHYFAFVEKAPPHLFVFDLPNTLKPLDQPLQIVKNQLFINVNSTSAINKNKLQGQND